MSSLFVAHANTGTLEVNKSEGKAIREQNYEKLVPWAWLDRVNFSKWRQHMHTYTVAERICTLDKPKRRLLQCSDYLSAHNAGIAFKMNLAGRLNGIRYTVRMIVYVCVRFGLITIHEAPSVQIVCGAASD